MRQLSEGGASLGVGEEAGTLKPETGKLKREQRCREKEKKDFFFLLPLFTEVFKLVYLRSRLGSGLKRGEECKLSARKRCFER